MINVFCNQRGSGKTKKLIKLANEKALENRGNIVYIDDDDRPLFELDRKIRFVTTNEFKVENYDSFYGFMCGMLSQDYDIDTVFIDGLFNIVDGSLKDAAQLFYALEKLSEEYEVDFFITINGECDLLPEYIKKYVA
ncbi:hypothetical protein CLOACE_02620 [Clostridium acetireducens DSM 10703]|uniref:Twitching motility protein PilT n=1 Tax=Clostridium acetireducens DSM 10703 TaxID=1121290 RepID=A0A1E8F1D0_9CLOT|nr:hypothetical protein [Clostridium acetireducens]OFI07433.1 hypothetical protein CLOACE_02620 [Clostridium acetireducens DSM 10703]